MPRRKAEPDEAINDLPASDDLDETLDPDSDDVSEDRMKVLGATVREIRRRKSLTLVEVAKQSGLSIALLSKLENGIGNPSLNTLARLTAALEIPIGAMFERQAASGYQKIQVQDQIEVAIPLTGVRHRLLVPGINRPFIASIVEIAVSQHEQPPHQHAGVEFISVLRGRVELQIEEESHQLEEGDSATYDPSRLHVITRRGRGRATLLAATSPGSLP